MVNLPTYTSTVNVSDGQGTFRTANTASPLGNAMAGLGQHLGEAANSYAHYEARMTDAANRENDKVYGLQYEIQKQQTLSEFGTEYRKLQEGADPLATGFTSNVLAAFDKKMNDWEQLIPPEKKLEFDANRAKIRTHYADQASSYEYGQRKQAIHSTLTSTAKNLSDMVATTGDIDTAKSLAEDTLKNLSPLGEDRVNGARSLMMAQLEQARVAFKISKDPTGTYAELRKYAGAGIVDPSLTPAQQNNANIIKDQWLAAGMDPVLGLMVANGESGLDHRVDMSAKINPKTGKPYSSAYGLFQFINDNWKDIGVEKTADPALQAAYAARKFAGIEQTLQQNHIEVTPGSFWGSHFLGQGGYLAVARAAAQNPDANFEQVYAAVAGKGRASDAVRGNGDIITPNTTVGEALNNIEAYAQKNYAAAQSIMGKSSKGSAPEGPVTIGGETFENLKPQDVGTLMAHAAQASNKVMTAQLVELDKKRVDGGIYSPYMPEHRKLVDDIATQAGLPNALAQGDANAYGSVAKLAQERKYLPKPVAAVAEGMLGSSDSATQIKGYMTLSMAHEVNPVEGLKQSGVSGDSAQKVRDFYAMVRVQGLDPQEAARRTEFLHSPDARKKAETQEFKDGLKLATAQRTADEVLAATGMARTWGQFFTGQGKTTAMTDAAKDSLTDTYRDTFEYHYKRTGDMESARAAALQDMKRMAAFTEVSGKPQYTIFPPETNYPPMKVFTDGQGRTKEFKDMNSMEKKQAYGYIGEQAVATAKAMAPAFEKAGDKSTAQALKDMKLDNIVLVPTPDTKRDITGGVTQPRYDLYVRNGSGQLVPVQHEWRANPAVAADQIMRANIPDNPAAPQPASQAAVNARDSFRVKRGN